MNARNDGGRADQEAARDAAAPKLRRLDHVAILVRDTNEAVKHYEQALGLRLISSETVKALSVRLSYLDCGNAFLQLVEPLDPASALAAVLEERGEGLHHICFAVDDVKAAVSAMRGRDDLPLGTGRGRPSAFVDDGDQHGVRIECTQFDLTKDVVERAGYLHDD